MSSEKPLKILRSCQAHGGHKSSKILVIAWKLEISAPQKKQLVQLTIQKITHVPYFATAISHGTVAYV